jgi:lecithin-cholesterol acyltransferase
MKKILIVCLTIGLILASSEDASSTTDIFQL